IRSSTMIGRARVAGRETMRLPLAPSSRAETPLPAAPVSCTKLENVSPVTARIFATDSVLGQRGRPSRVMRLDGLNAVGSSPARRARPEAESPCLAARRSMPRQTSPCCSIWVCTIGLFKPASSPFGACPDWATILVHSLIGLVPSPKASTDTAKCSPADRGLIQRRIRGACGTPLPAEFRGLPTRNIWRDWEKDDGLSTVLAVFRAYRRESTLRDLQIAKNR